MKYYRIFIAIGLICICRISNAQYGNEWIDVNTSYLRIKTYQNGIYVLTKAALTHAGMPSDADPRRIRLYHRGIEQQILISGEGDASFDSGDTLYFYGQRNDGTLDSALYTYPEDQSNRFLNLHSDTSVYFLNWTGSLGAERMSSLHATSSTDLLFHRERISTCFHDNYAPGIMIALDANSSRFDAGEGWSSKPFSNPFTVILEGIHNAVPSSGFDPMLELQVVGRTNYPVNRKVILKIGDPSEPDYQDTIEGFAYYETKRMMFTFPAEVLSGSSLKITLQPILDFGRSTQNIISLNYCQLTYSQTFNAPATDKKSYYPGRSEVPQRIELAWITPEPMIFDISNPDEVNHLPFLYDGSEISLVCQESVDSFLVISRSALMEPHEIILKQFTQPDITSDYYIISHPLLETSVQEYADYRSSAIGGNYSVAIAWTPDLYDLFSYGEFTPLAIYRYSKYLIAHNPQARFLSFMGKGLDLIYQNDDHFYRWNPEQVDKSGQIRNLVPTGGSPGSDLLYVMDRNLNPQIAVGRISGKNNAEILTYLNKVKEHEAGNFHSKNLIHLSGGNNTYQSELLSGYTNAYKSIVENSPWQGTVIRSIVKTDFSGFTRVSISEEVNDGIALITFLGHSTESFTDPDFGYASIDSNGYQNKGKYPMLLLLGCDAGNVFDQYSLVEDWINTPERGAIIALGGSEIMFDGNLNQYASNLYRQLFDSTKNTDKSIGEIVSKNLKDLNKIQIMDVLTELAQTQIILCGDPAVIMNPSTRMASIINSQGASMGIYPNPNSGVFIIESPLEGTIEIINSIGSVLYTYSLQGNTKEVHINVSPGIYFVRLDSSNKQEWKKLIIEK